MNHMVVNDTANISNILLMVLVHYWFTFHHFHVLYWLRANQENVFSVNWCLPTFEQSSWNAGFFPMASSQCIFAFLSKIWCTCAAPSSVSSCKNYRKLLTLKCKNHSWKINCKCATMSVDFMRRLFFPLFRCWSVLYTFNGVWTVWELTDHSLYH